MGKGLTYEGTALFPEGEATSDMAGMTQRVGTNLESLERSLKAVQVEMENLYALNFQGLPDAIDPKSLADASSVRALNPSRVAKLTRG
ncbi:MAG: hypothetical protein HY042_01365 [Spirochaetia bacterium]|nr:hypothetical protein [Spirochaetia bacterium]